LHRLRWQIPSRATPNQGLVAIATVCGRRAAALIGVFALEEFGARVDDLDRTLADPKLYERAPGRVATLAKERADAAAELAMAKEEWLALSEEYERAP
jgi:hypothetical protein